MAGYLGSTPVPQATQHRESFTCTEGQTSFATAGYTPQFLDVYLNGSHLSPADFVATNSSDVVLVVAASADDVCDIVSYTPFEVADATFTGTTAVDVATVGGTLAVTGVVTANGGAVFNEGSADVDFRVESNGNANAIFVDGGGAAVGIGVVPEAWATYNPVLQVGSASTAVYQTDDLNIMSNAYFIGGAWKFIANDTATRYQSAGGEHVWYNTASGSADATLTWVQQMKIKTSGEVTKPLQPSFYAVMSGNQTGYNAASTGDHTLVYNAEAYDIGSNFNTSTGRFTAPVDGTYQFVATAYCTSGTSMTQAWFVVGTGRAQGTDVVYQNAATDFPYQACTIKLDAGDVIGWHPYVSGNSNATILANNFHTWFKGTLLH